ncbi:MAG: feruloyl-CoA synthase [Rhizobiaceae bacterium]
MTDIAMRDVKMWSPKIETQERSDGSTLVWRSDALGGYPEKITEKLVYWAKTRPDQTWMAQRTESGSWRKITYGEALDKVRHLAQGILDQNLSLERPLVILSGNDIEHALICLAAQFVGVPSAALSPAYSLISTDYEKLRDISGQITPGLIFVADGEPFEKAINAAFEDNVPVVSVRNAVEGRTNISFDDFLATEPTDAVDIAYDKVDGDTILKFLFTSGTTGSPKAVIQTHKMICSNQEMVADCFAFMRNEPPVVVDWAPWNHTASGNMVFNMILYSGGTFYIDEGNPSPMGMETTIKNLREISPTWYFNVPAGYDLLVKAMEKDATLRDSFYRCNKLIMYAGAGMAQHTWDQLSELAIETLGVRVLRGTGLGSTETAPFAIFCSEEQKTSGNVGIPAQGVTLKLVPNGEKLEARIKGPNVTPGYWRNEKLTNEAFDEDGFYCFGDALRYAVPGDASKGFFFDGRIAENFKLNTGTWVSVGPLRAKLIDDLGGLMRDCVITGENQMVLGSLLVPSMPALRAIVPDEASMDDAGIISHPIVRGAIAGRLAEHAKNATGSANRVMRVMVLVEPLSLDKGEVTDKGSVNQRAVLKHRADLATAVYEHDDPRVICIER